MLLHLDIFVQLQEHHILSDCLQKYVERIFSLYEMLSAEHNN